jgi:hypothetical protein
VRPGFPHVDKRILRTISTGVQKIQDLFINFLSIKKEGSIVGGFLVTASHGLCPPCYPDLTPCDFYLLGSLKAEVYKTNPNTLKEPRNNHHKIYAITLYRCYSHYYSLPLS